MSSTIPSARNNQQTTIARLWKESIGKPVSKTQCSENRLQRNTFDIIFVKNYEISKIYYDNVNCKYKNNET